VSICCRVISLLSNFCSFRCVFYYFYIHICSFVTFLQLLHGTGYMVPGPPNFWGAPVDQPHMAMRSARAKDVNVNIRTSQFLSGISYLRLCVYHRHLDSFKASWRQYFFARPTRHDSWLLRLLEFRLTNFPTYLLTYQPAPTEFGTKAVIVTYCTKFHKPKLCTKFEVATFNAEISKGSQISWDAIATLAPTLCQFWS